MVLKNSIYSVFENIYPGYAIPTFPISINTQKFLQIPIEDHFELPVLVLPYFTKIVTESTNDYQEIAIGLHSRSITTYKTMDSIFKHCFNNYYGRSGLCKITFTEDNRDIVYYISSGTVFDSDFNCVAICTWEIKKEAPNANNFYSTFKGVTPIFRLHPDCFLRRDKMEKYLTGKLLNYMIGMDNIVSISLTRENATRNREAKRIKTIIEPIPFTIKGASTPSVNTTNQELLDVALKHFPLLNLED